MWHLSTEFCMNIGQVVFSDVNRCPGPCRFGYCPCPCQSSPWRVIFLNSACNTQSIVLMVIYLISVIGFYLRDAVSAVLATTSCLAGRVTGWLSVTRRYCIKTAKHIWKSFRPSESSIILVSWDLCADTQFHGMLFSGGVKYTRWEKWWFSCDFRRTSPFISETMRDRPMVTMEC